MKVFLSSTAQDLVAYRRTADDTILRLRARAENPPADRASRRRRD
jgi:hypothetical protein